MRIFRNSKKHLYKCEFLLWLLLLLLAAAVINAINHFYSVGGSCFFSACLASTPTSPGDCSVDSFGEPSSPFSAHGFWMVLSLMQERTQDSRLAKWIMHSPVTT